MVEDDFIAEIFVTLNDKLSKNEEIYSWRKLRTPIWEQVMPTYGGVYDFFVKEMEDEVDKLRSPTMKGLSPHKEFHP